MGASCDVLTRLCCVLPPALQGDDTLGPQVEQLRQDLREARRLTEAAVVEAARSTEESERVAHELAKASSKLGVLQVSRDQLQAKVRARLPPGALDRNGSGAVGRDKDSLTHRPSPSRGGGPGAERGAPQISRIVPAEQRGSPQGRPGPGALASSLVGLSGKTRCAPTLPTTCVLMVNHLPPQKLDEHQQLMDVITDLQRQKADREGAGPPLSWGCW